LKGHDFSRAAKADRVNVLKGQDFSRAAKAVKSTRALAPEGLQTGQVGHLRNIL
jgi:penicillin-binding protein-related factor A (putative recombinase)